MKTSEMVKVLTENQKIIIDALALGLRDEKFGKGEREFFENEDEMDAILHYKYRQMGEAFYQLDLGDDPQLKEERGMVVKLINRTLDYLANIDKAIESKGYWEIMEEWKEKSDADNKRDHRNGDREKGLGECEEADKGDA